MDIRLEERKTIFSDRDKVVHLSVGMTSDGKYLIIGCVNHSYTHYTVTDGQYEETPINLQTTLDMFYINRVTVHYDVEGQYRFVHENKTLFIVDYVNNRIEFPQLPVERLDDYCDFSFDILTQLNQSFAFYGMVDDIYFKLDDVIYQLIKNEDEYDTLFDIKDEPHLFDEHDYYSSYDTAWFIVAKNPPAIELFSKEPIDTVQIESSHNYDEFTSISGTEIIGEDGHIYYFAGRYQYEGEDGSYASYSINTRKKQEGLA